MRITKKFIVAGTAVVALVAGGGAAFAATSAATAPKITAEKAMDIAHKQVPGAWISELDYDRRGTRPDTWEIELTKGAQLHEVDVDAATGKVTDRGTKQSDGDDDDRDD
ncbi:PepSY domain-containing protein [Nonomuraea basaltis]|uniref:PepSY domain-containing protein n=1 Tax=Nonomuraea basaltis TaxID=2495887 RepID=UPI00110C4C4F|nr:PepSY domain-containing protein [Nonomuraea basaltis]TMS00094.1 PepSY domain-containing protein [Nonomuraea basaltis]